MIDVSNLYKTIDDFELGPFNLSIEPGLVTAIVGNNGAGKSTLLKMLMNLVKPNQGDIRLLERNISEDESWKQHVAYLPQRLLGYDPFNGHQLKEIISNLYPNWDESRFNKMVDMFNVNLSKKYGKMSQGMQQKLALALMLPRNPDIMILDEPTSHMDIPSKYLLMDILVEWMEEGHRTLILASHQTEEIRKLADTIAIIRDGDIIGHYEKDELSRYFTQYWLADSLPHKTLPGEVKRKGERIVITNQERELEAYLKRHQLKWSQKEHIDLNDAISLMLI
ncbi:ABC transporter ATP-binding protein [Tenuibacillus multivorans]|uniref:ABC transporter ATP-binding protein n=1 Tax=Tenuibacillus multivorans TaxID=237069 RepID=UPI001FE0A681|nr:ABC transporter ATP-binding protein [Tenuibacillus multivorans]